jgi:hypothetical protein
VESPGADVRARRTTGTELLTIGGAVAAATLVLTTSGDAYLVAAFLGLAALSASAAAISAVAFTAVLVRWGSSSLAAIAGAQAVLGPAVVVGPALAIVATVAASAALVLAARKGWPAIAFGLAGGAVLAGPATTTVALAIVRGLAAVAGAALAVLLADQVPQRRRRTIAGVAATVAVLAALVGV